MTEQSSLKDTLQKLKQVQSQIDREPADLAVHVAGERANREARKKVFAEYRARKSDATLKRQGACLRQFSAFLPGEPDLTVPQGWKGITWGLVDGFKEHLIESGYAISTINVRLSTIRKYAQLAYKADIIPPAEYLNIKLVEGYSRKEGLHVDEKRDRTRKGHKKAEPTSLTTRKVNKLLDQENTPQGRRDTLLIALLAELGLRISEVALLKHESFDLDKEQVKIYRPKVDLEQTHNLNNVMPHLLAYLEVNPDGEFWKGSDRYGNLQGGFSIRAMKHRVRKLGERAGIKKLSPHDLRHYWATKHAKTKSLDWLMTAGGWKSPAMAMRYIEASKIANE